MYGRIKREIEEAQKQINLYKQLVRDGSFTSKSFSSYTEILMIRISFYQHERLIHLLVTMLFALLTFGSVIITLSSPDLPVAIVSVLFLSLLLPYIIHYFHLENGVQKLYSLYDECIGLLKENHG